MRKEGREEGSKEEKVANRLRTITEGAEESGSGSGGGGGTFFLLFFFFI